MITQNDKIMNQLLSLIYMDKQDSSVVRINFTSVIDILSRAGIFVPPKTFEETFMKVMNERLVGKIAANDVAKWAIAQAILNTALMIGLDKEELLKLKLRENMVNFDKKR